MSDNEEVLQKEWRALIVSKLDSLDRDLKDLQNDIKETMVTSNEVANLKSWVRNLDDRVDKLDKELSEQKEKILSAVSSKFASKSEFDPIKKLVWTVITVIIVGVIGSVMALLGLK